MNAPVTELQVENPRAKGNLLEVPLMEDPLHCESEGVPILHLLSVLRTYHRSRDFSHQERFGAPDALSRQALAELEEAQKLLGELAFKSSNGDAEFLVEASLNVRMVPRTA